MSITTPLSAADSVKLAPETDGLEPWKDKNKLSLLVDMKKSKLHKLIFQTTKLRVNREIHVRGWYNEEMWATH